VHRSDVKRRGVGKKTQGKVRGADERERRFEAREKTGRHTMSKRLTRGSARELKKTDEGEKEKISMLPGEFHQRKGKKNKRIATDLGAQRGRELCSNGTSQRYCQSRKVRSHHDKSVGNLELRFERKY